MPYSAPSWLVDRVIQAESAGNPYARSPKGAMGLMQVMPGTAKSPGFGIEPLENPWDPEANKRFGTQYLGAMLDRYGGDEEASLAAYNWGPGNADKWVKAGKPEDMLPRETRDYIGKIVGRRRGRGQVYQPEIEPGTGKPSQAGWDTSIIPLGPDTQDEATPGLNLPDRPSKSRASLAEAMMSNAYRSSENTRGSPLAVLGSIAQLYSGGYMAGQNEDKAGERTSAIAEALAGAEDRDDLTNVMFRSGDPALVKAAAAARLQRDKPRSRYAASEDGGVFDKYTGEWKQRPPDPTRTESRKYEAREIGLARAKRRTKLFEDAREAVVNNRRLDSYERLNKRATTGGFMSDVSLGAKRFLGFFGMEPETLGLDDNAGLNEALKAMTTRSALDVSQQTKGAITEREMDMFIEAVPSLRNTKEGNQLIIDFLRAANNRRIALNKRAVEYVREHGTLDEGFVGAMEKIYKTYPTPDLSGYAQPDEEAPASETDAPDIKPPSPGEILTDEESGQRYRFKGGDPADPNNYERVGAPATQANPITPGPGGYAR